ncbi:mite allergen Der f 3-like [Chironomus tepperi]|uniref:mite allergen Der f 3-like n=1 Tax=Chironomus tepperi TaxID=113505 RepID=UPI00391F693D
MKLNIIIFTAFHLSSVSGIYYSKKASKNQFPYNVLIDSLYSFCTGALISDSYVLTAAHCLRNIPKRGKVKVVVGSSTTHDPDGKTIFADTFWMHENFSMPSAVYDIGLIKLPEPLVSRENIQWIKLSTKVNADLDDDDKEVEIAGWGYTEHFRGTASTLRYTKMNLIPLNKCKKYKSHYVEDMNEDHICTENIEGTPCSGDSGAAIVSTKSKMILGVVSYVKDAESGISIGYNDCRAKVPTVSTRISSYIDWIRDKTGLTFDNDEDDEAIQNSTSR